ncbi:hypothetical protein RSSL_02232 [Streptococcus salivarius K12]|uniref:Uncharacterized protein n=1 Tax=Streptococcus salivarius K12 TaxID=1200793 RepID=J7T6G5_STRSL|nr:hypothetical protein RSSL_02232 [Streptococcus salivarius K12]
MVGFFCRILEAKFQALKRRKDFSLAIFEFFR